MNLFEKKSIKPMLIGIQGEPFDDPDYFYELKLGYIVLHIWMKTEMTLPFRICTSQFTRTKDWKGQYTR